MSRLCLYQLKRCGGWATGSCECPHIETDDTESCKNYEVPAEIETLCGENRKLREAVILYKAGCYFYESDGYYWDVSTAREKPTYHKEYLDRAESDLRAEGVIE